DDGARVVDPDQLLDGEPAGVAVDLDGRHDRAEAPRLSAGIEDDRGLESATPAPGRCTASVRDVGNLSPGHPALLHPRHREPTGHATHVLGGRLEDPCGN